MKRYKTSPAMKIFLILILSLLLTSISEAQIILVKNGKATGRIIADPKSGTDMQAAAFFNLFVKKITGITLPVVSPGEKRVKGDLIIDSSSDLKSLVLAEDGFSLTSSDSTFCIERDSSRCGSFARKGRFCKQG